MLFLHAVSSDSAWSYYNAKYHFIFFLSVHKLQFSYCPFFVIACIHRSYQKINGILVAVAIPNTCIFIGHFTPKCFIICLFITGASTTIRIPLILIIGIPLLFVQELLSCNDIPIPDMLLPIFLRNIFYSGRYILYKLPLIHINSRFFR